MTFITTRIFQCEQTYLNVTLGIYNIHKDIKTFLIVITPKS